MPAPRRTLVSLALVAVAAVGGVLGAQWLGSALRDPLCEFRAADRVQTMSPEQSANASTISLISVQRGLPPRAASIAIATAIQESKLQNLTYGDADSLGLFQQRPSQGWGTEEQILDPVYSTGQFYDALVQVEGWQDEPINDVAQTVQRSAYPRAYADHEWEGRVMASALTGETRAALGCRLDDPDGPGDPSALAAELGSLGLAASADGNVVTVQAEGSAWAVAGWATTRAEQRQITRVSTDGRSWRRDEEPMNWHDDGAASQGVVQIELSG
ncbi:MAG TPA: hypothetical protein VJ976_09890 [Ornithinimicrobium sp.]|uniref:hypothetical protein n=1 Tax=Ornithinimicrobium sp. TaxID=1977084 RepID=UPI002B49BB2B|nr:hypothetical protein [Ornithinimicrobium sp.]HKJ12680.1 hypothetical protein [Ornithinimicrobium sp.]